VYFHVENVVFSLFVSEDIRLSEPKLKQWNCDYVLGGIISYVVGW